MAKRTKPEDMTPEQRERSERQKRARAEKAARRHTHPGEEQTDHDFGDKPHAHGPDGTPRFEDAPTEAVAPPEHMPSVSITDEVQIGATTHQHQDGTSHSHIEGNRKHTHGAMGQPVFLDKSDEQKETEHSSAIEAARAADKEAAVPIPAIDMPPPEEADIVLTVMEDGFTALGKTWYRGEEIRLRADDPLAKDSKGRAFYDMDETEQLQRHGRVVFKVGPARQFFAPSEQSAEPTMDELNSRGRSKKQQRSAGPPGRELVKSGPSG